MRCIAVLYSKPFENFIAPYTTEYRYMMLFYVEQGVKFTNEYGDIEEAFYNSMESMFDKAVKLMGQNDLKDLFQKRCQKVVDDTSGIGWGFHDTLSEIYNDAFEILI